MLLEIIKLYRKKLQVHKSMLLGCHLCKELRFKIGQKANVSELVLARRLLIRYTIIQLYKTCISY